MSAPPPDPSPSFNASSTSPATSSDITQSIRNACANNARTAPSRTSKQEGAGPRPREKKHGCWMCEKSFDRPSTLRKVPFVCDTCGRRFGVASNLNRHVKRCILKPVNVANRPPHMPTSSPPSASPSTGSGATPGPSLRIPPSTSTNANTGISVNTGGDTPSQSISRSHKRTREPDPTPPSSPPHSSKPPPKRRRRAPSPSHWIPHSLLDFHITPAEHTKPTPVPLPPVSAYKDPSSDEWIEERNSWDDNVAVLPYHPCGWKGTLPGPGVGLGGKDVMNLGLVNGGTYVMGRLCMV
ncbi:hypothetical protein EV363DRAFT_1404860 [Boletus edulis]|nr:hypothetical protein EV363DRAFT_1404860 [Boletus edulis]